MRALAAVFSLHRLCAFASPFYLGSGHPLASDRAGWPRLRQLLLPEFWPDAAMSVRYPTGWTLPIEHAMKTIKIPEDRHDHDDDF
jgi:hypothetical protein